MGTRFGFVVAATLLAVAGWTACTGADPSVEARGALGQPCNAGACSAPDLHGVGGICQLEATGATSGSVGGRRHLVG